MDRTPKWQRDSAAAPPRFRAVDLAAPLPHRMRAAVATAAGDEPAGPESNGSEVITDSVVTDDCGCDCDCDCGRQQFTPAGYLRSIWEQRDE